MALVIFLVKLIFRFEKMNNRNFYIKENFARTEESYLLTSIIATTTTTGLNYYEYST